MTYLHRNSANFCENCLPICPHENCKQDVISYEVQHCKKNLRMSFNKYDLKIYEKPLAL
jgi:hypothetical protein